MVLLNIGLHKFVGLRWPMFDLMQVGVGFTLCSCIGHVYSNNVMIGDDLMFMLVSNGFSVAHEI